MMAVIFAIKFDASDARARPFDARHTFEVTQNASLFSRLGKETGSRAKAAVSRQNASYFSRVSVILFRFTTVFQPLIGAHPYVSGHHYTGERGTV
jgi:hypothetical protein